LYSRTPLCHSRETCPRPDRGAGIYLSFCHCEERSDAAISNHGGHSSLDKPQYCGGIIEVAKALKNNKFNRKKLENYAQRIGNSGVLRRLGYLCELLNIKIKLPKLNIRNYLLLDPTMPEKDTKNARWRLLINLDDKMLGELE